MVSVYKPFYHLEKTKLILSTQNERSSYKVCGINMGVFPHLEFDNITLINCLGYGFYIYGAFEFL